MLKGGSAKARSTRPADRAARWRRQSPVNTWFMRAVSLGDNGGACRQSGGGKGEREEGNGCARALRGDGRGGCAASSGRAGEIGPGRHRGGLCPRVEWF